MGFKYGLYVAQHNRLKNKIKNVIIGPMGFKFGLYVAQYNRLKNKK